MTEGRVVHPQAEASVALTPAGWLRALQVLARSGDAALEWGCVFLLLVTVIVTLVQVFFRYILNASLSWPEELARWAFVWMVFVGMALALHRNSHVVIDLYRKYLPETLIPAHTLFVRVVICATSIGLLVHGWDLSSRATYVSPALEWHFRYLYGAVPAGAALNLYYLARERPVGARYRLDTLATLVLGLLLYLGIRHFSSGLLGRWDTSLTLVILAFGLILLGVPVAFGLACGTLVALYPKGDLLLLTLSQNLTSSLDSFLLLAIPFFIMMGGIMNISGITERLIRFATALVGHFRGGLAQVNIINSVMMGGLTGSSMADAAATSKTLVPEMEKHGYDRPFSCAVTAASSVLANLIPPSLSLLIYGALASASVGALFIATIIPGLLVAVALMVVVYVLSIRHGYGRDVARATRSERAAAFWQAFPAFILAVGITGGIRFGIFTATEAGAVAVFYALGLGLLFHGRLRLQDIGRWLRESFMDTVAVMFILAAASPFAWVLVTERVPQRIAASLGAMAHQPALLLLLINAFLLVVGFFIELVAAMVILVPILVPIVNAAGIDTIHFGIVLCMNLVMGALTPPMGMLVFTTARVAQANVAAVFRAVMPFVLGIIVALILVTYIPALSLTLPRILGP